MKGTRPPTRPNEIQDTFENCIDSLILKCQKYRAQAEEYRNDCIDGEHRHAVFSLVRIEGVWGVHILGGAYVHIKAIGSTPIPHQS